ncbi:unnamed protein product, partial [Ectocarpus sp. 12 AP-2014]
SAWGGSSWGGGGSLGRSSRSSSFASATGSLGSMHDDGGGGDGDGRVSRTVSGESEFYDAADGDGEPLSPDRWASAAAAAAAAVARKGPAAPQPGGEDTGSGEEGWHVGVSAGAAAAEEG